MKYPAPKKIVRLMMKYTNKYMHLCLPSSKQSIAFEEQKQFDNFSLYDTLYKYS